MDKAIDYARRAGARAMTLAAYEEAVRFYQMALQALERQAPEDEAQRCMLLLALGEAQRTAGVSLQALDTSRRLLTLLEDWGSRSTWHALPWSSKIRPGQRGVRVAGSASPGRGTAGARRGRAHYGTDSRESRPRAPDILACSNMRSICRAGRGSSSACQ